MPRVLLACTLLCTLFLSTNRPAHAELAFHGATPTVNVIVLLAGQPTASITHLRARSKATHFHFRFDPSLMASRWYTQKLAAYQQTEIRYLQSRGFALLAGSRFQLLLNGFSASIPQDQLNRLRAAPNVKAVLPQHRFLPLLDRSLPLIHVPAAWSQVGGSTSAGKGTYIANIDTGVDIKNPCFRDSGFAPPSFGRRTDTGANLKFTNNKVVVARAFGQDPNKEYSAEDTVGHGTFSAAIEACDYNTLTPLGTHVSGVAPGAYLMSYNIFPAQQQGTSDQQILNALDAALKDGADVINMSLGLPSGTGDPKFDIDAQAVTTAVQSGTVVVVSAGNAGPTPQSVGSPATSASAISVGASSNSRGIYSSIAVNGPGTVPSSLAMMKANEGSRPWTGPIGPAQLVYVGLGRRPTDDPDHPTADDLAGKDLHGKIALIQRGILHFDVKVNNVAKAGAIGAIVFNNQDDLNLVTMKLDTATLPATFINQNDGKALLQWVQTHPDATVTMNSRKSSFDSIPNILTDFSSRGYGPNYSIKPDLVGPGQDIYSATESSVPNNELYNPDGFTSANGTSFSAPHVSGVAALLLQEHPRWTPAMVRAVLMNTASADVYLDAGKTQVPGVMQQGAGLVDADTALHTEAYVTPASMSFGGVNSGLGDAHLTQTLSLNSLGGAGFWHVDVKELHGGSGVKITSLLSSVALAAGGRATSAIHLDVAAGTAAGDYDGFIDLTNGTQSLRIPYFVHLASVNIRPGSVLLVDASTSRYQPAPPQSPIAHRDVTRYYEDALTALGKPYTYWNEATQGSPALSDLKRATIVIYYTGDNFNALAGVNADPETLMPPLEGLDVAPLHSYMDVGGRVLVTGMGVAFSDPYWLAVVMGAQQSDPSVFDNSTNDKDHKGNISPTDPSAVPDTAKGALAKAGIFAGLKPIDFSFKGDGAGDNMATYNQSLGTLFGVSGLSPFSGSFGAGIYAYGQPALKAYPLRKKNGRSQHGIDVAVVSSDEPSLTHVAKYRGRGVTFSFGFEGINSNTGHASRQQVLQRVLQWFDDKPSARISPLYARTGQAVRLTASLKGTKAHAVAYNWQVGNQKLAVSATPPIYRFSHAGVYRLRVAVTDALGHVALSGWTAVTVR